MNKLKKYTVGFNREKNRIREMEALDNRRKFIPRPAVSAYVWSGTVSIPYMGR